MRHHIIHVVWLMPLLGAAALGADDLPQPKKDPAANAPPAAAPAPMPVLPGPRPSDADTAELQRMLRDLRGQRDALQKERSAADRPSSAPAAALSANEEEIARLRKR